ncbi:hypothetical protein [Agromyces sp. NPDC058104]|uniref:hypothetical protein n=1 Tax=Agromyces sp. NPDC058104 TaxID=3346342 RepID=UPI0036D8BCCC
MSTTSSPDAAAAALIADERFALYDAPDEQTIDLLMEIAAAADTVPAERFRLPGDAAMLAERRASRRIPLLRIAADALAELRLLDRAAADAADIAA